MISPEPGGLQSLQRMQFAGWVQVSPGGFQPSWTTEQRNAYTTARDWARRQLLPWALVDTYATWYATVRRNLFESRRKPSGGGPKPPSTSDDGTKDRETQT